MLDKSNSKTDQIYNSIATADCENKGMIYALSDA